jgi:hypothetical protein
MDVLYDSLMTVRFTYFKGGDAPQLENVPSGGGTSGSLLPEHDDALRKRFPDWSFYRRR